jgi:hypothetical protein
LLAAINHHGQVRHIQPGVIKKGAVLAEWVVIIFVIDRAVFIAQEEQQIIVKLFHELLSSLLVDTGIE